MTAYLYVAITPRYMDGCRLFDNKTPLTYIKIGDAKDPDLRAGQYYTHNPDVAFFPITFVNWSIDGILDNKELYDELQARVGSFEELKNIFDKQPGKIMETCVFDKNYSKAKAGNEWYKAVNCEANINAFLSPQDSVEHDWKHFASPIDFVLEFRKVVAGHSLG